MATAVVMPKQGNTVESCIIVDWKKAEGDQIAAGEVLCEVETDKATLEVESTAAGTILALYFEQGDEVPVLTPIAAVGKPGDDIAGLGPDGAEAGRSEMSEDVKTATLVAAVPPTATAISETSAQMVGISPRAKNLAHSKGLDISSLQGTGPGGRTIERDIISALAAHPQLTPVARRMLDQGDFAVPAQGSGISGRITSKDLTPGALPPEIPAAPTVDPAEVKTVPVQGVRKVIVERMLRSLQTTAQLTLNASADARALLAYRKRLNESSEAFGLRDVTIGDLVLFVVSRTLPHFPELNAHFTGDTISLYKNVHLAFAVDTPRGLIVPVIRDANALSLKQISLVADRLATACQDGRIAPDDLNGGTFTVSNLGALGIENFTPVLNLPQVSILGVGNVNLKPVDGDGDIQFIPHIGLSLTINHQVVDGVPGARFLQALAKNLADLELIIAL